MRVQGVCMSDINRSLKAKPRTEDFGSAGARRLLRGGQIPAVIYGKKDPVHIALMPGNFQTKCVTSQKLHF